MISILFYSLRRCSEIAMEANVDLTLLPSFDSEASPFYTNDQLCLQALGGAAEHGMEIRPGQPMVRYRWFLGRRLIATQLDSPSEGTPVHFLYIAVTDEELRRMSEGKAGHHLRQQLKLWAQAAKVKGETKMTSTLLT